LLSTLAACSARGGSLASAPEPASASAVRADAEKLRADVAWLADDAQEGRRAGTESGRRAGEWLAARMQEIGLEPAGEDGWLQEFRVPLPVEDGGGSWVRVKDEKLAGDERVLPLFCSDGSEASGPLVFAGYGISNEEVGWNDYADFAEGGGLSGSVALVVRGTPPLPERAVETPAEDAAVVVEGAGWGNSASLFSKVMNAKRRGALAVVVAVHPGAAAEPLPAFDASRSAQASIPALVISVDAARTLLPQYEQLVAEMDATATTRARAQALEQIAVFADVRREKGPAYNVLGRLRGKSSERAVIVGAHYDHLGRGGEGSLAPSEQGEIHNGADDNASGTAAVLEIARILASGPEPESDIVFALWSGEELGLLGSEHWAKHPTVPLEQVAANLNLDMVGRAGSGKLAVLGVGTAAPFEAWVDEAGPAAGLATAASTSGQGVGGSDHQTFLKRKIPALHLFTGVHADYHKPSDDLERFEADGSARVVGFSVDLVRRMAAVESLAYVEPKSEPTEGEQPKLGAGWRVWFGSMPDYAFEGPGVRLSGTSEGSPAEKAGLLAGDVLLQVGDVAIGNIYDFMHALQTYKPGDVVLTKFLRDGREESVRVTLATRDAP